MNTPAYKRGPYTGKSGYVKRHNITMDSQTADILRNYGNGNLSEGVRRAAVFVDATMANQQREVNK